MIRAIRLLITVGLSLSASTALGQFRATDANFNPKCVDTAGQRSARYFTELMRAAMVCYTDKVTGKISENCQTSQIPYQTSNQALVDDVSESGIDLGDSLIKKCGTGSMGYQFGYPCDTGTTTIMVDSFKSCVISRAHGQSAGRVQKIVYNNGEVVTNKAALTCQAGLAYAATRLADAVMKARRSCGKALLFGKICDDSTTEGKVAKAEEAARGTIKTFCPSDATVTPLRFGGLCAGQHTSRDTAMNCIVAITRYEADETSKVVYDTCWLADGTFNPKCKL